MRRYEEGRAPLTSKSLAEILSEMTFLRGLGKNETRSKLIEQWNVVISNFFSPEIVKFTVPGSIRNGRLTVFVNGSSAILQELTFIKQNVLTKWNQLYPEEKLRSLLFKQGK